MGLQMAFPGDENLNALVPAEVEHNSLSEVSRWGLLFWWGILMFRRQ